MTGTIAKEVFPVCLRDYPSLDIAENVGIEDRRLPQWCSSDITPIKRGGVTMELRGESERIGT